MILQADAQFTWHQCESHVLQYMSVCVYLAIDRKDKLSNLQFALSHASGIHLNNSQRHPEQCMVMLSLRINTQHSQRA